MAASRRDSSREASRILEDHFELLSNFPQAMYLGAAQQ